MKILFVNAIKMSKEYPNYSLGQMILKKQLETQFDVELVDFDFLASQGQFSYDFSLRDNICSMGEYLLHRTPDVISFYTMCNMFHIVVLLTSYLKRNRPGIRMIWAGPQATLLAEDCLCSFPDVDIIARGEGETYIVSLMRAIKNRTALSDVMGISYRMNNRIVNTPDAILLNETEFHRYMVYDYSPYSLEKCGYVELEGGRGCPFGCTFCTTKSFWQQKFRVKPVEHLIEEMDIFNKQYGVCQFVIIHDMFTANRSHLLHFCDIVKNRGYSWNCSSRLDALTPQTINIMKSAGCHSIYAGIETGSKRMQKVINKNLKLDKALRLIDVIKNEGIDVTLSFIFGFPDEEESDLLDTLSFIQVLLEQGIYQIQLHRFIPLPETVETGKVLHSLYFDQKQIDDSVVQSHFLDEVCVRMILNNPRIFSAYYTFDTPVTIKYRYLDGLSILFHRSAASLLRVLFEHSNLADIYLENENLFRYVHDNFSILGRTELRKICLKSLMGKKTFD